MFPHDILNGFLWPFPLGEYPERKSHPLGSGHIHDTMLLRFTGHSHLTERQFVLQKINHSIFDRVEEMMENMTLVTAHLAEKYSRTENYDRQWQTLRLVKAKNGRCFWGDDKMGYWRCFDFIESSKSYDLVTKNAHAYQGGIALGRFQADLMDLDPGKLHEVLPDFHNIEFRLRQLRESCEADILGRLSKVKEEIKAIKSRAERMYNILQLGRTGHLPLRITHNDTKFNNILLNNQDLAIAVIDLDTVMPGYVAYDFGDAVRTIISSGSEDAQDLRDISLCMDRFEALTDGYFSQVKGKLTLFEIESLIDGVLLLPYLQAVRFLTDYLNGDRYFKIHRPGHNLDRCRAQMYLLQLLEKQETYLHDIVFRHAP